MTRVRDNGKVVASMDCRSQKGQRIAGVGIAEEWAGVGGGNWCAGCLKLRLWRGCSYWNDKVKVMAMRISGRGEVEDKFIGEEETRA